MRLRKRIFSFILAAVMLFSLTGCALFDMEELSGKFENAIRSNGTKFSDMVYERPDIDNLRDCVDGICDMLDSEVSYNDVVDALDEFYTMYWNFYTMLTLAEIHSDLDTSDKFFAEEYEYCSTAEADLSTMFSELMVACADSHLSDKLDDEYFGGILAENYSGKYENGFDELNKLYLQESALLAEYRSQLVEFYACSVEEEAYKAYNPELCRIYIDLVKVRHRIAAEMGFDSYEELAYAEFGREYTPDDLEAYLSAIKEYIVPLFFKARESGILQDAYYNLRDIDPEDSLSIVENTVSGMDSDLKRAMRFMMSSELYDVSDSEDKLDGSYVTYLDDYNSPFLFVKSGGYEEDILTIAHEFGHFADAYENFDMNYNLDTSETLSQGMEYLIMCYLEDGKLSEALTDYKMTDTLYLYLTQACYNEFEHRVFALPENELTVDKVNSIYAECAVDYGFGEDYGDLLGLLWVDVTHLFEYPFYIISYCISDSAAFSIYAMELDEAGSGLRTYLSILDDAENTDFVELLEDSGIKHPLSEDTIKDIAEVIALKLDLN